LRGTKALPVEFEASDPGANLTRNATRDPSAGIAGNRPAAMAAARAMMGASVGLAVLASACDRADAARLYEYRNKSAVAGKKHRQEPAPAPKGPLQIIISIADQKISVYSGDVLLARSAISTGVPGHPTPKGVFTVIQKQRWHRSNLYSAAPMPFMQRITWSGVALHAGFLPGYPASHGCIRLTEDFAVRLWQLTKLGNRVIIAANDVAPIEISHPQLFGRRSKPDASASLAVPAKALEAAQATSLPPTGEFIKPVKAVGMAADSAEPSASLVPEHLPGAAPATQAQPNPPAVKAEPISIFISRKQSKLFVRQGYAPLFESAVTIRDPERPLGTHVFTAIERKENSGAMRWTVVSFPGETAGKIGSVGFEPTKGRRGERETRRAKLPAQPRPSAARASAALERIEIPPEAADRIAELLSPKSSLIVSDQALSEETDSDTDFIVLVR
jgi:lipoprotein-anchoring transpeptidase ErfK/SrfK